MIATRDYGIFQSVNHCKIFIQFELHIQSIYKNIKLGAPIKMEGPGLQLLKPLP